MQKAINFFRTHAGYSYDPATETAEQGRQRCAEWLAECERWALDADVSFEWGRDDVDSSEFSDDPEPWGLWFCIARGPDGEAIASLGAIDFGRDGEPWGDSCRRVVEAELAAEAQAQLLTV